MNKIEIETYFHYNKTTKQIIYFVKLENELIIVGQNDLKQLMVLKQFANMLRYTITDDNNNPGECLVNIVVFDGVNIETTLSDLVRQHPISSDQEQKQMSRIYQEIEKNLIETKVELLTAKLETHKLFSDIAADLKFGDMHIRGDVCFIYCIHI